MGVDIISILLVLVDIVKFLVYLKSVNYFIRGHCLHRIGVRHHL